MVCKKLKNGCCKLHGKCCSQKYHVKMQNHACCSVLKKAKKVKAVSKKVVKKKAVKAKATKRKVVKKKTVKRRR